MVGLRSRETGGLLLRTNRGMIEWSWLSTQYWFLAAYNSECRFSMEQATKHVCPGRAYEEIPGYWRGTIEPKIPNEQADALYFAVNEWHNMA